MGFDPCNLPLKIRESIGTPTPKMGVHLGVWRFIPSHSFAFPGAWDVTLGLPSCPATLQALALVASPRLGLRHLFSCTLNAFAYAQNSIANVPILYISWIIICANCIFSLYVFLSTHAKDDDECDNNFTTNSWIFNMPSLFVFFNFFLLLFFSTILLPLPMLTLLRFLSLVIIYSFSIALSTLMLLWTPKLRKCAQLPTRNINCFQWLSLFCPWTFRLSHLTFYLPTVF